MLPAPVLASIYQCWKSKLSRVQGVGVGQSIDVAFVNKKEQLKFFFLIKILALQRSWFGGAF